MACLLDVGLLIIVIIFHISFRKVLGSYHAIFNILQHSSMFIIHNHSSVPYYITYAFEEAFSKLVNRNTFFLSRSSRSDNFGLQVYQFLNNKYIACNVVPELDTFFCCAAVETDASSDSSFKIKFC